MTTMSLRRFLPVSIGGNRLLIDASRIVGIEQGEGVQRNPGAGRPYGWLLGSSDGATVFDLAEILGLEETSHTAAGSVLVLSRSNGELWGLLVDHTEDFFQMPGDHIIPLTAEAGGPFSAIVPNPNQPTLLLASERLHPDNPTSHRKRTRQTRRLTQAPQHPEIDKQNRQMLWISVDSAKGHYAGLSTKQVVEISDLPPIAPLPSSKSPSAGFAVYDGKALPIADLGRLFDRQTPPHQKGRLLIARGTQSPHPIGLPIFDEVRLVKLPVASRREVPKADKAPWIRGSFQVDQGTVIVPDLDAILERRTP